QRTENPRVVGSIPTLATISFHYPSKTNDYPMKSGHFIGFFQAQPPVHHLHTTAPNGRFFTFFSPR
ncbi:MAG: hypothetical protein WCI20_13355, partial [bacterium]